MATHITAVLLLSLFPFDDPRQGKQDVGRPLDRTLAEVSYIGEDFDDALRDWSEQAGVNLVIDWPALEALGIYSDTRIDLSLHDVAAATALQAILSVADQRHLGATYDLHDGVLTVTSQTVLSRQLEVRTYDCAALLKRADDAQPRCRCRHHYCLFDATWRIHHFACSHGPRATLLNAIESTVDPDSWEGRGGPATARIFAGKLVIRQTDSNHDQISHLLLSLEDSDALQAITPSAPEH